MRVKIAALADYASVSEGKKLNILGIFSVIYAPAVPCRHSQMAVVVQIEFEPGEAGRKELRVELQDEDGREVFSMAGAGVVPPATDAEPVILNQIIVMHDAVFARFGQYEFKIVVDGEPLSSIPVKVVRVAKPGPMGI